MTAPFDLTGQFGGFVFTDLGKRRMLLRQGDHDRLLKVPRILRRRIIGKFREGELIRVAVTVERNTETGLLKQVVSRVLPTIEDPSDDVLPHPAARSEVFCVMRVCSKKNCWRNGGRELWEALDHELAIGQYSGNIELRQVGCLDRCKQAPNVDCGNHIFTHCSQGEARAIVTQAADHAGRGVIARE